MNTERALADISATQDLLERALKLSGLVSSRFADVGFRLVVVGGSAVEFYTEGGYMSGDIDFCRREPTHIPLRLAQDIMAKLGAVGGPRSWQVCGLYVDMLGMLENESTAPLRTVETPYGLVTLVPRELALVERVLSAYYPQPSVEALKAAKQMMASSLLDPSMDWAEAKRLADLMDFKILPECSSDSRRRSKMDRRISLTWEQWKAGREAKREALRKRGLADPSRRSASSSDQRLRKAFGGQRVPNLSASRGSAG